MKNTTAILMETKRKNFIYLFGLCLPLLFLTYRYTHEKHTDGYQFLLFFFSILPTIYVFDLILFNAIKEEALISRNPFYLMKYVVYAFLILFSLGPFVYLWSMREVLPQLRW